MKQYQLVEIGKTKLEAAGISEAGIDAELLWLFLSKQDKMNFILNRQEDVASEMADAYLDLIGKRASRMPLQYITGTQNFMGFDFLTAPGVLIPRFDTETLVEQADKRIEKMMRNAENRNIRVLDMCCGSGCIGLSIALMNPDVSVDLCDISEDALSLTKKNADALQAKCSIIKSDLFQNITGTYDLIVSNPPYIESAVIDSLMPEVKDFEPRLALDGDTDGLKFYRKITEDAENYLNENGYLLFEIGNHQAYDVQQLLVDNGFADICTVKDLCGNDRVVTAKHL